MRSQPRLLGPPLTRLRSLHLLLQVDCAAKAALRRSWLSWRGREVPPLPDAGWLRLASAPNGGRFTERQVEEVAMVLRLVPTFCTTILYWTVYSQMGSVFVEQGQQMDCSLFGLEIPAATLSTFDTIRCGRASALIMASERLRSADAPPPVHSCASPDRHIAGLDAPHARS